MIFKILGKATIAVGLIMVMVTAYTAVMTGIGQVLFHHQANGSQNGQRGSLLIAQPMTDSKYLWGRQMSISTQDITDQSKQNIIYAVPSQKSPSDPEYQKNVKDKVRKIKELNPNETGKVPLDLVTNSGSGLDPDISSAAADYQVARIANARNINIDDVQKIIQKNTSGRTLGLLGEKRVNVLSVNVELDKLSKTVE